MDWYEEWFGEEYKLVYPHRNEAEAKEQIDFLRKHVPIPENAKVLDLCCGCGSHPPNSCCPRFSNSSLRRAAFNLPA